MRAVTLYRLSGLAVMIGMTIDGIASVLYSRAGGTALYRDPLVPVDDLAKLSGSLIFLIRFPGLYAFQATRAGKLGLAGFALSFFGLAVLEVGTEALFAFAGPVLATHDQTRFLLHGGLEQNLGGGFTAYFALSYVLVAAGFVSFGIATFRAGVYPRRAGAVIGIGTVAAIALAPLVSVPSGPLRLDRAGVLAAAFGFAWCGWHLLRNATAIPRLPASLLALRVSQASFMPPARSASSALPWTARSANSKTPPAPPCAPARTGSSSP
jgi:hypothetical protein